MGRQEAGANLCAAEDAIPTVILPGKITTNWQDLADTAAEIMHVPSCLITQVKGPDIDILISSRSESTPYIVGESLLLCTDVYSQFVVTNRTALMLADAREEPAWNNNPDMRDYGMVSYFGLPLFWPGGEVFGTLAVLDRKKNNYDPAHLRMLEMFQSLIMKDLELEYIGTPRQPNPERPTEELYTHRIRELEREINRRIENERSLNKVAAKEFQASRNKSDFMANMSLELLSPLNAIIGFSELIKNEVYGPLGQDCYRDYAKDILNSGQHLLSVINDVLDVSKLETGEIKLRETECDMLSLSASCLRMVTSRAIKKGVTLSDFSEGPLPLLYADPVRIKQILNNILTNAVKFTSDKGSITMCTHVSDSGDMIIEISDTGSGIDPLELKQVMEPFSQLATKPYTHSKGKDTTGLGLSIVKSMMELHDGTIELISSLGVGTTVLLTFPAERVRPQETNR